MPIWIKMRMEGKLKKVTRLLCAAAFGLVVSFAAFAQDAPAAGAPVDETTLAIGDAASPQSAQPAGSSLWPYILRMVLVLGLVLAAIYGLYALLKRSSKPASREDNYLRVLASAQLSAGRYLHVASLGDRAWLVGSTDSSMNLIAEISDKELIDTLELKAQAAPEAPRRDFSTLLSAWLKPKASSKTGGPVATDFFSRQKDRLKKF